MSSPASILGILSFLIVWVVPLFFFFYESRNKFTFSFPPSFFVGCLFLLVTEIFASRYDPPRICGVPDVIVQGRSSAPVYFSSPAPPPPPPPPPPPLSSDVSHDPPSLTYWGFQFFQAPPNLTFLDPPRRTLSLPLLLWPEPEKVTAPVLPEPFLLSRSFPHEVFSF